MRARQPYMSKPPCPKYSPLIVTSVSLLGVLCGFARDTSLPSRPSWLSWLKPSHHEEPSAAKPQPKQKLTFHHEGHEEHEVQKYKISESFVAFVCFVVRSYFLVDPAT